MKALLVLASLALVSPLAFAGSQQNRMKECNVQAKGKKGDERKAFMKSCLSGKNTTDVATTTPAAPAPGEAAKSADPKQRVKDCNVQAKGKKGDDRKAFMASCLKSSASNTPAAM